ncbi:MAG TPA: hypothetical protein VGN97_15330 [Mesorhizobium sp.]|jgi:hypothetical protein|nr:hypothetical protein [Mesorhizobium sp.]
MRDWLADVAGPQYVEAILWTLGALAALAVLLLIVRLARGLRGGTFVAGGRNRRTRLAVMDATAIDTHRRLVLVRRDDVEHLLLIGGPTDVVVEQNIRLLAQRRPSGTREFPADLDAAVPPAPTTPEFERAPEAPPTPRPATPVGQRSAPVPAPATTARSPEPLAAPINRPGVQAASPSRPSPESGAAPAAPQPVRVVQPRPEPPRPNEPRVATAPARAATPLLGAPQQPARRAEPDDMDEALMRELEVSFDELEPSPAEQRTSPARPPSLDDEMTRLLGELSSGRR